METITYATYSPPVQFDILRRAALTDMPEEVRTFCLENDVLPSETIKLIHENIFYEIPFHYGFKITTTGRVVDLYKGIEVQPTLNKTGYYAVTVRRDGGDRSITAHVHRLLALTFLPPEDRAQVADLQVNHIDGVKVNNALDNLEWVTQQRNCEHAYQTGLREDNKAIKITCAVTGKEIIVYSMGEAGRFFGVTAAAIHWQINNKKSKTPYKGYYVAYADNGPQ